MPRDEQLIWTPHCEISYQRDLTGADKTGTITREAYIKLREAGRLRRVTSYLEGLRNRGYEFTGAAGKSGKLHDKGVARILGHADRLLAQLREMEKGWSETVGVRVEGTDLVVGTVTVATKLPRHPMVLESDTEEEVKS